MAEEMLERRSALLRAAEERGLAGLKLRQIRRRLPEALVEQARRARGLTDTTQRLTYALLKVASEDECGNRLPARKGTFLAD